MNPSHSWLVSASVHTLTLVALAGLLGRRTLWIRSASLFGVPVSPADTRGGDAMRIWSRFRIGIVAGAALGALTPALLSPPWGWLGSLWLLIATAAAFARAHQQSRRLPRPPVRAPGAVRHAALTSPERRRSAWLHTGPYLILAACGLGVTAAYDVLPDAFPLHYDFTGAPDRWVDKSWGAALAPVLFGTLVCGLLASIRQLIRRLAPEATSPAAIANRRTTFDLLHDLELLLAITFGGLAALPLLDPAARQGVVLGILVVLGPGILILLALRLSRHAVGGSSDGGESAGELERSHERHWRAGLLYSNSADPALFVPKRVGLGYTINLAHRGAWAVIALIALIAVLPALLLR